ncbi:hypothetical protein [Micromonospora sp. NPDC051141]|uniref:hypothetical protein n=1 Tax=Micromonospora sp. NPDC051141 TaxID=3364284 RepID=UPI0037A25393
MYDLIVLVVNRLTVHHPFVNSAAGPVHGAAYLAVIALALLVPTAPAAPATPPSCRESVATSPCA